MTTSYSPITPADSAPVTTTDVRKLVSIETVAATNRIPDADAIEAVTVRGWTVVTKLGEFQPGDRCVYFEIDAFLPLNDDRYSFLEPRGSKNVDGVCGHVLRTARLRGVYSQGLVLPMNQFPELDPNLPVGTDVTSHLGITKYDPPLPADLSGVVVGLFPTSFAPKTDAERVQNLTSVFADLRAAGEWYATEKVDGTSATFIKDGDRLRVCSRNLELAYDSNLTQVRLAEQYELAEVMTPGMVVQAEVYGDGVQKNPLGIKGQALAVFAVLIDQRYLPRSEWPPQLLAIATPIYDDLTLPETVAEAVEQADGIKSLLSPGRKAEGIVWHSTNGIRQDVLAGRECFKSISNAYLLKQR